MVQVDLPAAFAVGQAFGIMAKKYLKKEPDTFFSKLLGPFNFYLTCGFIPGGMFLLIGWPAWECMYTTNWVENPFDRPLVVGFYILFMIVMIVLGNAGFILAHKWYRKGKDKWVAWGTTIGVVLAVLPFALRWGIWMNIGTYADVKAGAGYSFWDPPFFHGWLAIMSWLAVTMILAGLWFRKKGNSLAAGMPD